MPKNSLYKSSRLVSVPFTGTRVDDRYRIAHILLVKTSYQKQKLCRLTKLINQCESEKNSSRTGGYTLKGGNGSSIIRKQDALNRKKTYKLLTCISMYTYTIRPKQN